MLLSVLICSCGKNSTISPSLPDSRPSSVNPSVSKDSTSPKKDTTLPTASNTPSVSPAVSMEERIKDTLERMTAGNFTLEYSLNGNVFEDVITEKYFYTGYLNNGAVLLKTFSDSKIAYDFQLVNDKKDIELKGQTFNAEQTAQGIRDISYSNQLKNLHADDLEIKKSDGVYQVRDDDLILALVAQLDFNGTFARVDFYLDGEDLVFELKTYDFTKKEYVTPDGGRVRILNVGRSTLPAMEAFLSEYKGPTSNLVSKADNLFGNVYFESAVYDYTLDYNRANLQGYSNLEIYDDFIRVTEKNDEGIPYVETYKKQEDGSLNIVGINGKNEVVDKKSTKLFSDFQLVGKEGFELDQFCKMREDDEYYLYLGSDAKKLAYSVTQSAIFSKYPCLKIQAKTVEGKVTELHFYTGIMQDRDTGEYFFYRIDTMVHEANEIKNPVKKAASKDDARIKGYLSKLNQDDSTFKVTVTDSALEGNGKREYIKGKDFYLKKDYVKSGEEMKPTLISGSYLKNGKVYPFHYDYEENLDLNGSYEEKGLAETVNFTLASEILTLEDDKIKTTGDIIDIGKSIGFSSYPDYIDPTSLVMTVDSGSIFTICYEYGGSGFSGNETMDIDYSSQVLPDDLKNKIENKISSLPSRLTWESKNVSMYKELVDYFGEEFASKVPYLNTTLVFDHGMDDGETYFGIYIASGDVGTYIQDYRNYLLSLGYVTSDSKVYTNSSDGIKLEVLDDKDEFLKIYKL